MPMGYNADAEIKEGGGARAEPGVYFFKVDAAAEKLFRSGNEGAELVLLVGAFEGRDVKVFERFVYTDAALWKLKQFFDCTGFDFRSPPEVEELVGVTGMADFERDEKGYLRVKSYLPGDANNGPDKTKTAPRAQSKKASVADDDLPF